MSRDWRVYLDDVRDCSARVIEYTDGLTFEEFAGNRLVYDGVLRNLEIIGEAVKHVPEGVRALAPEIPWRRIAGFRDRLAHAYFDLDPHVVWDVVRNHVPALRAEAGRILRDADADPGLF